MIPVRALVGLVVVLVAVSSCGRASSAGRSAADLAQPQTACEAVQAGVVEDIIGSSTSRAFELPPLSECTWSGEGGEIIVRIETVPDPQAFIAHSIESTDPDLVIALDALVAGAVEFQGEALLGSYGDHIVLVQGSPVTSELRTVLAAAVAGLAAAE